MQKDQARLKMLEDKISSLNANLRILEIERKFGSNFDAISSHSLDKDIALIESNLRELEDKATELQIAIHKMETQQQQIIIKDKTKTLQSFFDKHHIQFDVELFYYLLKQTVRAIGSTKLGYHFSNYPLDELTAYYDHFRSYQKTHPEDKSTLLQQYQKANEPFSRLAVTFYYLDSILGPTLHSFPILSRLFQLSKLDVSQPQEDIDAMNALLCALCYKQTSLKRFLNQHLDFFNLRATLEMFRDYIGRRTELAGKLSEKIIMQYFERHLYPSSFQLKQLHKLSAFAFEAQHESISFFNRTGINQKHELTKRTLSKLADYYCERRMILKEDELLAILDKTSPLRNLLSDSLFAYPDNPFISSQFEKQYDSFPVPDDADNPHDINFFP